ncbi:hypothetical protein HN777_05020 [Candidatus Woesearchaeota archaeon]|nr:hypothetical protein [Candidatus Woesearchaeota archaeon]
MKNKQIILLLTTIFTIAFLMQSVDAGMLTCSSMCDTFKDTPQCRWDDRFTADWNYKTVHITEEHEDSWSGYDYDTTCETKNTDGDMVYCFMDHLRSYDDSRTDDGLPCIIVNPTTNGIFSICEDEYKSYAVLEKSAFQIDTPQCVQCISYPEIDENSNIKLEIGSAGLIDVSTSEFENEINNLLQSEFSEFQYTYEVIYTDYYALESTYTADVLNLMTDEEQQNNINPIPAQYAELEITITKVNSDISYTEVTPIKELIDSTYITSDLTVILVSPNTDPEGYNDVWAFKICADRDGIYTEDQGNECEKIDNTAYRCEASCGADQGCDDQSFGPRCLVHGDQVGAPLTKTADLECSENCDYTDWGEKCHQDCGADPQCHGKNSTGCVADGTFCDECEAVSVDNDEDPTKITCYQERDMYGAIIINPLPLCCKDDIDNDCDAQVDECAAELVGECTYDPEAHTITCDASLYDDVEDFVEDLTDNCEYHPETHTVTCEYLPVPGEGDGEGTTAMFYSGSTIGGVSILDGFINWIKNVI